MGNFFPPSILISIILVPVEVHRKISNKGIYLLFLFSLLAVSLPSMTFLGRKHRFTSPGGGTELLPKPPAPPLLCLETVVLSLPVDSCSVKIYT